MAYRIDYTQTIRKTQLKGKSPHLPKALLLAFIALVLSCVLWGQGCLVKMLPGDPEVTAAAAEHMAELLQNGEGFYNAMTAFCQEVLAGAYEE